MIRCIQCGQADLEAKPVQLPGTIRNENYTVEMQGLECPRCGYKTVEGRAMPEYGRLLADKYRAGHGLLTSEQIRARRIRLGMTQEKFAEYIGVGLASVKRWEMGKIQDEHSNERIVQRTAPAAKSIHEYTVTFGVIHGSTYIGSPKIPEKGATRLTQTAARFPLSIRAAQTLPPHLAWLFSRTEGSHY